MSETYSTRGPTCPHCDYTHKPEDDPYLYAEDLTRLDCNSCGKKFNVSVYISYSWTCMSDHDDA